MLQPSGVIASLRKLPPKLGICSMLETPLVHRLEPLIVTVTTHFPAGGRDRPYLR